MIIHSFGDSHADHPWGAIKLNDIQIKVHILRPPNEPMTCSSFGFNKLNYLNIQDFDVKDGEVVCFSFGETDCRFHVHKHKEIYKEVIDKIIENYFLAIKVNIEQFNNIQVIIVTLPPVVQFTSMKKKFSVLGEDFERKKYVEYFNSQITKKCLEYKYNVLNTYNLYLNESGYMNKLYGDIYCHIMNPIYFQDELIKILK